MAATRCVPGPVSSFGKRAAQGIPGWGLGTAGPAPRALPGADYRPHPGLWAGLGRHLAPSSGHTGPPQLLPLSEAWGTQGRGAGPSTTPTKGNGLGWGPPQWLMAQDACLGSNSRPHPPRSVCPWLSHSTSSLSPHPSTGNALLQGQRSLVASGPSDRNLSSLEALGRRVAFGAAGKGAWRPHRQLPLHSVRGAGEPGAGLRSGPLGSLCLGGQGRLTTVLWPLVG